MQWSPEMKSTYYALIQESLSDEQRAILMVKPIGDIAGQASVFLQAVDQATTEAKATPNLKELSAPEDAGAEEVMNQLVEKYRLANREVGITRVVGWVINGLQRDDDELSVQFRNQTDEGPDVLIEPIPKAVDVAVKSFEESPDLIDPIVQRLGAFLTPTIVEAIITDPYRELPVAKILP